MIVLLACLSRQEVNERCKIKAIKRLSFRVLGGDVIDSVVIFKKRVGLRKQFLGKSTHISVNLCRFVSECIVIFRINLDY